MSFRILTLDGGGSKGVYTLGILNELEQLLGSNLCNHFNLIFGTSNRLYIGIANIIGKKHTRNKRTLFWINSSNYVGLWSKPEVQSTELHAKRIFGESKFEEFKVNIGVVAMNYDDSKPLIFKSDVSQAYTREKIHLNLDLAAQ
jgi:predicted patatin/cPLA2 family phospholipase